MPERYTRASWELRIKQASYMSITLITYIVHIAVVIFTARLVWRANVRDLHTYALCIVGYVVTLTTLLVRISVSLLTP